MFRWMMTAALALVGMFTLNAAVEAHTKYAGYDIKVVPVAVIKKVVVVKDYHFEHGKKFDHGYYYDGHHHKHWTKSYYCPEWKATFYYCPSVKTWYYYHAAKKCYYPVSYLKVATPRYGDVAPKYDVPAVPYAERPILPSPKY